MAPTNRWAANECPSVGGSRNVCQYVASRAHESDLPASGCTGRFRNRFPGRRGDHARRCLSIRGLNTAATLWCSAAVGSLCGFGFIWEGVIGAVGVLGANVLFRPLARKIDRQPSRASDVETKYVLTLVCRSDDETKVRILLMHLLHALPLTLHALRSEDLNTSGKVEVRATLVSAERQNAMLEEIVQRLSVESGISAVSWELGAQDTE